MTDDYPVTVAELEAAANASGVPMACGVIYVAPSLVLLPEIPTDLHTPA